VELDSEDEVLYQEHTQKMLDLQRRMAVKKLGAADEVKEERGAMILLDVSGSMREEAYGTMQKIVGVMTKGAKGVGNAFLLDFSGSAKQFGSIRELWDTKLESCCNSIKWMLGALEDKAQVGYVGLVIFNDKPVQIVPMGAVAVNRPKILEAIKTLKPDSGTALYNGFLMAKKALFEAQTKFGFREPQLLVLTDGQDTESTDEAKKELENFQAEINRADKSQGNVFSCFIGVGAAANSEELKTLGKCGRNSSFVSVASSWTDTDAVSVLSKAFLSNYLDRLV